MKDMTTQWSAPVFVVGASRSGTAMLRSILMQDGDVSLAGETHYFDDLRLRFKGQKISQMDAGDRDICADYFRAISERPYGKGGDPGDSRFSRDDLLGDAAEIGDTTDSIFEAYCKRLASEKGAHTWGEKTPRHVFRIDDIFDLYPDAKVVCMVRDPRAVVASYRDWNIGPKDKHVNDLADMDRVKKSYNIVLATLMWRAAANAAILANKKHGPDRVRIVRYEDVIATPETTTRDVVRWLGIDYSSDLLSVPLHNSSTMGTDHSAGISTAPQNRWRKVLSEREIGIIQKVAEPGLTGAGFELLDVKAGPVTMALAYAGLPFSVVRAARANRGRVSSLPRYAMRRIRAVMGV